GTEILDCLYVMETGMRYFFMRAQAARSVKGNEAVVRANMLEAVSIAEKIAPYRHHRLAAIKVHAKDLAPPNYQKSLEELRAQMQKHFERLAPVLDLEAIIVGGAATALPIASWMSRPRRLTPCRKRKT